MGASAAGTPLAAPLAPGTWPSGPLSDLSDFMQIPTQQQQQQIYIQQQHQMQQQLQQQMQLQLGQQMLHMHGTLPSCGGLPLTVPTNRLCRAWELPVKPAGV